MMATSAFHAHGFVQYDSKAWKALAMANGSSKQPDPTKAVKQAIEATKTYGATSYKARIAWEVVEKMEYKKRNSKEPKRKSDIVAGGSNKTESPVVAVDATFDAVENDLTDLRLLLDREILQVKNLKDMANEIKEVKNKSRPMHGGKSIEAIAAAQEAIREHGIHSSQTALAWEAFEEIVSNDTMGKLAP